MQAKFIQKRDHRQEKYNANKIKNAVLNCLKETNEVYVDKADLTANEITNSVESKIDFGSVPDIESIQDLIETEFFNRGLFHSLRAYIVYREQRRQCNKYQKSTVDVFNAINEYVDRSDWRVNANANQGYSLGGLILNTSGKLVANYWLDHIYPENVSESHRNGDIHIHDLDVLGGYCAGWSLRTLLQEGFNGVSGRIESTPPKHMGSAVGQIVNFLGCFTDDTEIVTIEHGIQTIRYLIDNGYTDFTVVSADKEGKIVETHAKDLQKIKSDTEVLELEFDDGYVIRCTPDHKFLLNTGEWVEAQDLMEDHILATIDYDVNESISAPHGEFT